MRIAFALLAAALAGCVTTPELPPVAEDAPAAETGATCAPHPAIFAQALAEQYGETPAAIGIDAAGNVLQAYASERGTWTIVLTRPDGVTCIMSAGEGWEVLAERALPGVGS